MFWPVGHRLNSDQLHNMWGSDKGLQSHNINLSLSLILLSYSGKFSNGANFRIFRTYTNCVKIRNYASIFPRVQNYPILSHKATFHLLRCSRCPCKHGSPPHQVKEACTMFRKVQKSLTCVPGGVAWRTWKIQRLELRNFTLKENTNLYENMHQRKFPAIQYNHLAVHWAKHSHRITQSENIILADCLRWLLAILRISL